MYIYVNIIENIFQVTVSFRIETQLQQLLFKRPIRLIRSSVTGCAKRDVIHTSNFATLKRHDLTCE